LSRSSKKKKKNRLFEGAIDGKKNTVNVRKRPMGREEVLDGGKERGEGMRNGALVNNSNLAASCQRG